MRPFGGAPGAKSCCTPPQTSLQSTPSTNLLSWDIAMRRFLYVIPFVAFGVFLSLGSSTGGGPDKPVRKDFGIDKRVPWTTSKVIGSPEPPPPYTTEPAFPKLPKFEEPLDLTYAPGSNRLFVAGRWGKIWSFVNKRDVDKADLVLEFKGAKDSKGAQMKEVICGMTFHHMF